MSKKRARKTIPVLFLAWDYENEERYINRQAEKGWQLVCGRTFSHTYERSDQKYRCRLDFFQMNRKSEEEAKRYLDLNADMGWEYVGSAINGWNYFRKKYVEGTDEEEYALYTDNESLSEMLGRLITFMRIFEILSFCNAVNMLMRVLDFQTFSSILLCIMQVLLLFLFEFGIIQMKRKQKRKPALRFGRVGSYIAYVMALGCLITFFITFPLVFRTPCYHTSYQGNLTEMELELKNSFEVGSSRTYRLSIDIKSGSLPVTVSVTASDGTILYTSETANLIKENQRLYLKEGSYYLLMEPAEEPELLERETRKIYICIE